MQSGHIGFSAELTTLKTYNEKYTSISLDMTNINIGRTHGQKHYCYEKIAEVHIAWTLLSNCKISAQLDNLNANNDFYQKLVLNRYTRAKHETNTRY